MRSYCLVCGEEIDIDYEEGGFDHPEEISFESQFCSSDCYEEYPNIEAIDSKEDDFPF